ncbi:MAG: SHOCT domain-containing protein [Eubacteriales bacterium]|jgi:hypothetical protein
MATKTANSAAGNVTLFPADPYSYENLLMYHTSLSLIERMVQEGFLSPADYRKSVRILSKKYGFPPGSIFAELA